MVELFCDQLGVSGVAYYHWHSGKKCARDLENEKIAEIKEQIHIESPDKGYCRIKDDLSHDHKLNVNEKRVLRICRSLNIKSTIKYKNNGCTRQAANPQHIAKNWRNRLFHASMRNEKWLTDVTEFKYYIEPESRKLYLSAILDLYDKRIVAYTIGDSRNNQLLFDNFEKQFLLIQAHIHCSIVTEDTSTPARLSMKNFRLLKCGRVCPESADALTTVRWRVSGAC